jgi:hypothetical protein
MVQFLDALKMASSMALLLEVCMAPTVRKIPLFWTTYIPYLRDLMLLHLIPPQVILEKPLIISMAVFKLQSKYNRKWTLLYMPMT